MSVPSKSIADKVKGLIREHLCLAEDFRFDDSQTLVSMGADDLDMIEVLMSLETYFGITITDEDWAKSAEQGNLGTIIELVTHKANGGAATVCEAAMAPVTEQSVKEKFISKRAQMRAAGEGLSVTGLSKAAQADLAAYNSTETQGATLRPAGLVMRYFVLSPGSRDGAHAEASVAGIRAYAEAIRSTNPSLADDILEWLEHTKQQEAKNDEF